MKRLQQSVLLAGVLTLSLTACSSIGTGWKGLFGSSPMAPQAAAAPAPAHSATTTASPTVTASAAQGGNADSNEPSGQN